MLKIKICGITNNEDAQHAANLGADAIGFIFVKDSPRSISLDQAEEISLFLPPFVTVVGVFANADAKFIETAVQRCKLDIIQLHGNEPPNFCLQLPRRVIKTIHINSLEDIQQIPNYQGFASAILLDTKTPNKLGGTGQTFDWGLAIKAKEYELPIILAGGLNTENIKKAIKLVNPYGIDMASGVESQVGKKDYNKLKEAIQIAKKY